MHGASLVPVGRPDERSALAALIDDAGPTARVALVEGPAGIGKTTLWNEARLAAAAAGRTVVTTRCIEGEAALRYAGLGDLLGPLSEHIDGLPAHQRAVVRSLVLRDTEAGGEPVLPPDVTPPHHDDLTVMRATTATLTAAARSGLVVAIDDVQWLDAASARAVSFAFRRLGGSGVRALLTRRTSGPEVPPLDADRWWGEPTLELVVLGPLDVGAMDALLRARLGVRLRRPQLLDLHRRTDGNPLYALEIVRAALASGALDGPLAIPPTLQAALRHRVEALPADTRTTLLVMAASGRPSATLVQRVVGADGMAVLKHAGEVISVSGDDLWFNHPLLADAVLDSATPWARRAAHAALAEVVTEPEARGRHLALATVEPDHEVADEIHAAATAAAQRGATDVAAALAQHAHRLTPRDDERWLDRCLFAAVQLSAAGDPDGAATLLVELRDALPPGRRRADVLCRLSDTAEVDLPTSVQLCLQALDECDDDPALAASIHLHLATYTWLQGDLTASNEHGRRAAVFAERSGDASLTATVLADLGHGMAVQGLPGWDEVLDRAVAIGANAPSSAVVNDPVFQRAVAFVYTDRLDEARADLVVAVDRARLVGDESQLVEALFRVFELELRAGNWSAASTAATECASLARQAGIGQEQAVALTALVVLDAHLGMAERAIATGDETRRLVESIGDSSVDLRLRGALGMLALSLGDARAALEHVEAALPRVRSSAVRELSIHLVAHNAMEAYIAVGALDDAEELASFIDECGAATGRAWHRAVSARGRALIASARGDESSAGDHIEDALAAHRHLPQPFELARTRVAEGVIARRSRRRAHAREALGQAIDGFERLGAAAWAELARSELARVSGRSPLGTELSVTEQQVAALVAQGMSNAEIASTLFVSVRAVESTLTKVYRKLGVRSRSQLISRSATASPTPDPNHR